MFLSRGLDDESRCNVGMATLPSGKVLNGLASQGLYEVTLREEFARLNKLTGSLTQLLEYRREQRTKASWTALREP
jgi:hypothetical protein